MKESDAYSPGAEHPMNQYNVKANGLPAVRKEQEPAAYFDRNGSMLIHTENQANIFECGEKTPNVHRSAFFDEPDPASPYDDPNETAHN